MAEGKVVVVTGASAGLGRAIAHAFAKRGCRLALLARNPEALEASASECVWMGGEVITIPTDVSDADVVDRAATEVEAKFGPIDIWVNDAMVSVFSPVKAMSPEDYKRVTEVTYLGCVYGTLSALRRMLPRDRGTIVQIGSALAYRSIPLQSAYCASKHAINGFTDSLRCELFHDKSNVRLTTVHMPAMNTPQFDWVKSRLQNEAQPVPPIYDPEACALVVVEAAYAKHPRREYWLGFPTVKAIVGTKLFPGLLDRYLGAVGYESQQIQGKPHDPEAPNNLHHYVPGTHSARGKFDKESRSGRMEASLTVHRPLVLLGLCALLAGGVGLLRRRNA
ncbi:MAG TPA: SDR family oxidoreductase [Acidobacteriaceae bacterium]|jgi:NAD(P)-dependent dehydrogenase (short-subunit alcohol dehydrogenase family)